MDYRNRLFLHSKIYEYKTLDNVFIRAVRKNVKFHKMNCKEYANILKVKEFKLKELKTIEDMYKLPFIPTLYFKTHTLRSMKEDAMFIKATSSGTKGKKSQMGFELKGLLYGAVMVIKTAIYHKLLSIKPTNYIILGYQPHKSNPAVINKTQFGSTLFAPAIKREYALKYKNGEYELNLDGLKKTLIKYSRMPFPIRFIGFPSYTYFLLKHLKEEGIRFQLHKDSKVLLGGGWKQFYTDKVEKAELYQLIEEVLGIKEENCKEFFGAVEHPIVYCDCKNHHFHVPVYSRVLIRDINTLKPVKNGEVGLVNLITPMVESMPLVSIMTDDLGILHDGKECGCGIKTPYFEILGRVGVKDIKTCAASADEIRKGGLSES